MAKNHVGKLTQLQVHRRIVVSHHFRNEEQTLIVLTPPRTFLQLLNQINIYIRAHITYHIYAKLATVQTINQEEKRIT